MSKNNRVLIMDDDEQLLKAYSEILNPKEFVKSVDRTLVIFGNSPFFSQGEERASIKFRWANVLS